MGMQKSACFRGMADLEDLRKTDQEIKNKNKEQEQERDCIQENKPYNANESYQKPI